MIRYLKYLFYAALAVVLITLALANRAFVEVRLLPAKMEGLFGFSWSADMPLFIVIFGALIAGILVGFTVEWFREHRHRSEAATHRRERKKLEREVSRLKVDEAKGDDVLALLDTPR